MKKISSDYLAKSKESFELFDDLKKQDKYVDWQMTTLFYSILCYIKAYFFEKNENIAEQMNSHASMQTLISQEKTTKRLGLLSFYYPLYCYSRDARYKFNKIKKIHIEDSIKKYNKIKELLALEC